MVVHARLGRVVRVPPARRARRGAPRSRGGPSEGEPPPAGRDGGREVGAARRDELLASGERPGLGGAAHEVVDRLLQVLLAPCGGIRGALLLRLRRRPRRLMLLRLLLEGRWRRPARGVAAAAVRAPGGRGGGERGGEEAAEAAVAEGVRWGQEG